MTEPTPAPAPQPAPGAPAAAAPGVDFPGKTLGIVAMVLSIIGIFTAGGLGIVGFILGLIGNSQSKKAGFKNGPAKAAIIIGIITIVIGVIVVIILSVVFGGLFAQCAQLGPGVHEVNGVTVTCS